MTPEEPPVTLDPPQVEVSQTSGSNTVTMVRMTNLGTEALVWSSYTAESSCAAPSTLSWVIVSPDAGTVQGGGDGGFTVDTTKMAEGEYHGHVCTEHSGSD